MNESIKPPFEKKDKFPDADSPDDASCYMYVFYKLGLDPYEAIGGIYPEILTEHFTKANSKDDADALVIRRKSNGRYDHMAFIDQSKNGEIKQRGNVDWQIEATSIDTLERDYPPDKFEYVFLKKKTKNKNILLEIIRRVKKRTA